MAGPAARRSRAAMTAKAALLTTAVLVGTAWGGVSAFVVQPQGSVPPRSGVAGPRSLAGRLQGVRVGRDHLPGRRGCTGSCGRLVPTSSLAVASAASAASVASVASTAGGVGASLAAVGGSVAAATPILGSIGVLALVITLHEAGHLVAALSQGIRVETFSIGLGPKLLSYRSGGEKGFFKGTLSGPSWDVISPPPGSDGDREAREGGGGGGKAAAVARARGGAQEVVRKEVGEWEDGVEYTLRAIPVGGFVSFPNNYDVNKDGTITEYDDPDLLYNRGPVSRGVVVAAGVVVNFLLAWACIFGSVSTTGIVKPHYAAGVIINEISDPKGGAAAAGFRPKDVFLSINGNTLTGDSMSLEQAVKAIRASEGKPVAVELSRDGAKPVTRTVKTALGPSGKYTIGVLLAPNLESVERAKAANPVQAAGMAFEETAMLATKTLDSFVHLASTGDAEGVSGPVEIVKVGAQVANEDGVAALLQFAAVISVNLAVINSLPVPGLDGGQMVFVLAELISQKKLERGVTETINGVALLILLAFSLSTFAGDLGIGGLFQRIVGGGAR